MVSSTFHFNCVRQAKTEWSTEKNKSIIIVVEVTNKLNKQYHCICDLLAALIFRWFSIFCLLFSHIFLRTFTKFGLFVTVKVHSNFKIWMFLLKLHICQHRKILTTFSNRKAKKKTQTINIKVNNETSVGC